MLTEEYLKDHYVNAYFVDEDRKHIEVQYSDKDFKRLNVAVIEYDTNHSDFQALNKIVSIDDLHENTYQKKKLEKQQFEEMAISIAKRDGLVLDYNKIDTKFYPMLVKAIFEEPNNEDNLFALKLALFEVDKIRDSKDEELKKALRQSENVQEAIFNALFIVNGKERS
jgi:hypothetical protein